MAININRGNPPFKGGLPALAREVQEVRTIVENVLTLLNDYKEIHHPETGVYTPIEDVPVGSEPGTEEPIGEVPVEELPEEPIVTEEATPIEEVEPIEGGDDIDGGGN